MLNLAPGEYVCIGPPGGAYTPTNTTVALASPSVYTTTASHANPTVAGTIPNCGKYYTVVTGDQCNTICLNFKITFSSFVNMNPSINVGYTNLVIGMS
jgi:hypothetical protein